MKPDLCPLRAPLLLLLFGLWLPAARAQTPLTISDIRLDAKGRAMVSVPATPGSYFILYRGVEVAALLKVADLESDGTLGHPQQIDLSDNLPTGTDEARFYRVENVSLANPKDSDGDGMDDAYELSCRPRLNPLDPKDAAADPDNDGRTNLAEYRDRTDRFTAKGMPGLVWIPPGTFMMGSPDTEPNRQRDETLHSVTLVRGFFMGQYEVTQEEYLTVMGNNPSFNQNGRNGVPTNTSRLPVEQVRWIDSTNYCAKLTVREREAGRLPNGWVFSLPTEAQWEYACRAGTKTPFHYGTKLTQYMANFFTAFEYDIARGGQYFVTTNISLDKTTVVGSYQPNAWGLYDMHGNVSEWCQDWYGDFGSTAITDPKGPNSGSNRIFRGGSWNLKGRYCRSALRDWGQTSDWFVGLGFRVVLVPVP